MGKEKKDISVFSSLLERNANGETTYFFDEGINFAMYESKEDAERGENPIWEGRKHEFIKDLFEFLGLQEC